MKVRWTAGSVRFRITPAELKLLERGERAAMALHVPGGVWEAAIAPVTGEPTVITLTGGALTLSLSPADLVRLSDPETEGVYFVTDTEPRLRYFIEKDFPCVHTRPEGAAEPDAGTFEPPQGFAERHK